MQTQQSSNYLTSTASEKYAGLIVQPVHKRAKSAIEKYIAFFDFYPLEWPAFHWIVSILRMFQFLGPSLITGDPMVWGNDNPSGKFISFMAIFYNYIPATVDLLPIAAPILLSFAAVIIIYLLIFLVASVQYSKTGKTPQLLAYGLNIFCNSAGFLMQPFCERILAYVITQIALGTTTLDVLTLVSCILNQICTIISFMFISSLFLRTLNFHPCSMLSLEEYAQMMVMLYSLILSAISSVIISLPNIVRIIGMGICGACYFASILTIYYKGTFVQLKQQILFTCFAIWGGLNCFSLMVFAILERKAGEVGLALFVLWGILSFLFATLAVNKKVSRHIMLLDIFEDEHDATIFKSPSKLVNVSLSGFQIGHPTCLDYSIFRAGCSVWPDSGELWFVFAKFNVIYPENTSVLNMISQSIQAGKIKSNLAKFAVSQISTVQRSRESNLTSELKSKIEKITKIMNGSKRKMRNMWDLILQGNTKDLESNSKSVYTSVQNLTKELDQLMMQFPNNRFVARLYARYMNEVLADDEGFRKWHENVGLLQRGITVRPDNFHEMGIAQFENIPNKITNEYIPAKTMLETDMSLDDFTDVDMKGNQRAMIPELVAKHKVAAIKKLTYSTIFVVMLFSVLPTSVILGTYLGTRAIIAEPLDYLYGVAYLRQLNYMMGSISGRVFMCRLDRYDILDDKYQKDNPIKDISKCDNKRPDKKNESFLSTDFIVPNISYAAFGYHNNTVNQLKYFLKEVSVSSNLFDSFRKTKVNNDNIHYAKQIMFEDTVPYNYYYTLEKYTTTLTSAETCVNNVANQLSKILHPDIEISVDLISTTDVLIAWNNFIDPGIMITDALENIIEYMNFMTENYNSLYFYIEIALILAQIIAIFTTTLVGLYNLSKDKQSIFRIFTYLPKTVISNVSSSFYNLKGGKDKLNSTMASESNDASKPEEAILKIFTSIADSSFDLDDSFLMIVLTVVMIIFGSLGTYFASQMVQVLTDTLRTMAPHINYLLGTSAFLHGIFASLFKATMALNYVPNVTVSVDGNLNNITDNIQNMRTYYSNARYGGNNPNDNPYVGMAQGLIEATSQVQCQLDKKLTDSFFDITSCIDMDQNVYVLLVSLRKEVALYNTTKCIDSNNPLSDLWILGPIILYETVFSPMAGQIVDTINEFTVSEFYRLLMNSLIFMILCVLALIAMQFQILSMEKPLIFALSQLQHCPEDVCLKIPRMMALLSGDYSSCGDDSSEKDDKFFDNVVNKLTGMIAVANMGDNAVQSINKAFATFFGYENNELVGKNIWDDFFESGIFEGNFSKFKSEQNVKVVYTKDGTKLNILWTLTNLESEFIIEGRDISTQVRHETLISDEKKRSDAMLASILPASLVPRVQAGESNISFAVKSVTVSFIDVVSFTPWCGSNTAQYVMKMLNLMFKEFDSVVASLPTLTRIKCIGDCYMCAGGIFDEVNQPSQHARDMVDFGCQAIGKIQMIDQEHNEKLQIRCGVNTGGPIVAGILGSDKPTFEILGPTINIAQQMEHHGVPMNVHISRAVYELIYGDKFQIKERGEIDVKNTKMYTYLVTP